MKKPNGSVNNGFKYGTFSVFERISKIRFARVLSSVRETGSDSLALPFLEINAYNQVV